MSVCRKLPDGTVQKIAGHTILLDANAAEIREGTWSMPATGHPITTSVTFTDPMPDTDYTVVLEINTMTSFKQWTQLGVRNKTTTGFEIFGYFEDSRLTVMSGEYTAWKPVKIEGYTALQNKVNSPDDTPTIDSMNLVTSDGVARAIENASAVWKGTKAEWNALPAAEKQTYDLAVLLDETLVKAVDREDGTETDVANLNKIFRGTEAEWQALSAAEKDEYDQAEVDEGVAVSSMCLPYGVVQAYAGSNVPTGWLLCDGQAVSRVTYASLFSTIGTTYGIGDGSTTFNVPDYRECALVGAGQNDTDIIADHDAYTLGEFKNDQIQNITGKISVAANQSLTRNDASSTSALYGSGSVPYINGSPVSNGYADSLRFDASRSVRAGTTTHGKRKGVNYIIFAGV